jgi:hypothetical protein
MVAEVVPWLAGTRLVHQLVQGRQFIVLGVIALAVSSTPAADGLTAL